MLPNQILCTGAFNLKPGLGHHNQFLCRKSVTWHHPIGGEVTGYNPYSLCMASARWAQEGYGNSDNRTRRLFYTKTLIRTLDLSILVSKSERMIKS